VAALPKHEDDEEDFLPASTNGNAGAAGIVFGAVFPEVDGVVTELGAARRISK
jgi:hypothetical protein